MVYETKNIYYVALYRKSLPAPALHGGRFFSIFQIISYILKFLSKIAF